MQIVQDEPFVHNAGQDPVKHYRVNLIVIYVRSVNIKPILALLRVLLVLLDHRRISMVPSIVPLVSLDTVRVNQDNRNVFHAWLDQSPLPPRRLFVSIVMSDNSQIKAD